MVNECFNPKCKNKLLRHQRKFCSHSCSAKYNNSRRPPRSEESRKKTQLSVLRVVGVFDYTSVRSRNCFVCKKLFWGKDRGVKKQLIRKTCSDLCYKELHRNRMSNWLKTHRDHFKSPHQRSYMEVSFADWLQENGMPNGINGYLEQIHFWNKKEKKSGWPDFVFPRKKLIIELDGTQHRKRVDLDRKRDKYLLRRGWKVVRITASEYKKGTRIEEIKSLLFN